MGLLSDKFAVFKLALLYETNAHPCTRALQTSNITKLNVSMQAELEQADHARKREQMADLTLNKSRSLQPSLIFQHSVPGRTPTMSCILAKCKQTL
jgi:hypothetical protein